LELDLHVLEQVAQALGLVRMMEQWVMVSVHWQALEMEQHGMV